MIHIDDKLFANKIQTIKALREVVPSEVNSALIDIVAGG